MALPLSASWEDGLPEVMLDPVRTQQEVTERQDNRGDNGQM